MGIHEIRKKYLDFFKERGHVVLPSSPLVPENDPTTLFTGSGMQPMISFLLGEKHPQGTRVADSQKCFRAEDLEEVGDNRHTTYFEMLGNWSFGDYFKKEQIAWMFEFVTKELKLDPKRIYISVFRGDEEFGIPRDDEAVSLWQEEFRKTGIEAKVKDFAERDGMSDGRIFYYPGKKNWWSRAGEPVNMPIGEPGGPDSEMFWDFGEKWKLHESSLWKDEPCHVNCDCGRFMEFGNNVFMSLVKKTEKAFEELPNKNIDFGGGLERIAAAINDNPDMFLIDVFTPVRESLESLSGKKYLESEEVTRAFRVIMDHIRGAVMLMADGVLPSNKDQGYFTRRLIRRSIRFMHKLGIGWKVITELARPVVAFYSAYYADLVKQESEILKEFQAEEDKFTATLEEGLKRFEIVAATASVGSEMPTNDVFDLYQSYGFPYEITEELAKERGLKLNRDEFLELLSKHKDVSRAGVEAKFKGGLQDNSEVVVRYHTATHLLHAALRMVLGKHVGQKGSNITAERLRFDFTHPSKMTAEEVLEVERLVNAAIERDYPVTFQEMTVSEAKEKGALGFFEEKYGDRVKVYSVGDPESKPVADPSAPTFSKEICGGPHVERTGVIGRFKIVKEEAVSSGVRRIKAIIEKS